MKINWKALWLSVLTMTGFCVFVCGMTWVGVTFGAEYALLPLVFIAGLVIFYVAFDVYS